MTQFDEKKSQPSQLSLEFSATSQTTVTEIKKPHSVVTHFITRESITTRREAIERVRRDGIFPVSAKEKA